MSRVILFSLLIYLLPSVSQGGELTIGEDIPYRYLEDPGGRMTLEQFLAIPDDKLTRATRSRSWGYTRSAYWMKLHLPAALFQSQQRWLQVGPNFVDHITLYYRVRGSNEPWTRRESGDLAPYDSRDLDYRYAVFKLPEISAGGLGYDLVFRVKSTSALHLQGTLWEPESFTAQAMKNTLFWSFYLSLAAISSVVALLLAIVLGNRMFWAVCAFSLSYLLVACIQGYLGWLWGGPGLYIQHYLTSILVLYTFGCLLWMCCEVLNFRRYLPRLYLVMNGVALAIGALLLGIPLDRYGEALHVQVVLSVGSSLVLVAAAFYLRLRKHIRPLEMMMGLGPLLYVMTGGLASLIMNGIIAYRSWAYELWEYLLMGNMFLVLAVAIRRVSDEHQQARQARQTAREWRVERAASFHQRQFIGMVSHEFRTPLAIISGTLDNLSLITDAQDPRHRRFEKIRRATARLTQLTDNCLADARLSSSQLYLDLKRVDLLEVIEEVANVVSLSDQHRLQVSHEGRPLDHCESSGLRFSLMADQGLLSIALSNLLDNAVKYSPGGEIGIDIRFDDRACVLSICDQGPGIHPDEEDRIFERYRRAGSADGGVRGSGLGLYVAREIARAHKGDLQLNTGQDRGACFVLSLPGQTDPL